MPWWAWLGVVWAGLCLTMCIGWVIFNWPIREWEDNRPVHEHGKDIKHG